MKEEIWWSPIAEKGLEHLVLRQENERITAEGLILRVEDKQPFRLAYQIICDANWRVREVKVERQSGARKQIRLFSDGAGVWTDDNGNNLPDFAGCFDVDISATPFTNTLPVRRIGLKIGETTNISVVYFLISEMTVQRSSQRYTKLADDLFRFEETGLFDGFSADLKVDEEGLVIEYPQLFRRIWE